MFNRILGNSDSVLQSQPFQGEKNILNLSHKELTNTLNADTWKSEKLKMGLTLHVPRPTMGIFAPLLSLTEGIISKGSD